MARVLYTLRRGMQGSDVQRLQKFLVAQGIGLAGGVDGDFGGGTARAVEAFQRAQNIDVDGVLGKQSLGAALPLGYDNTSFVDGAHPSTARFPERPQDFPPLTAAQSRALFGEFPFRSANNPGDPEQIVILNDWEADNMVRVDIPQLVGMVDLQLSAPRIMERGTIRCHRLAAPKFLELFQAWGEAGLMSRVLNYVGAFNARLKRGRTNFVQDNLSNHSRGTAMDINTRQNGLGHIPSKFPSRGCVRELVEIANQVGFFWGGHFSSPKDGMHFELGRL